jgi:hypothetical protein
VGTYRPPASAPASESRYDANSSGSSSVRVMSHPGAVPTSASGRKPQRRGQARAARSFAPPLPEHERQRERGAIDKRRDPSHSPAWADREIHPLDKYAQAQRAADLRREPARPCAPTKVAGLASQAATARRDARAAGSPRAATISRSNSHSKICPGSTPRTST